MHVGRNAFTKNLEGKAIKVEEAKVDQDLAEYEDWEDADLNQDGYISGAEEAGRMFSIIDNFDGGSNQIVRASTEGGLRTQAGKMVDAANALAQTAGPQVSNEPATDPDDLTPDGEDRNSTKAKAMRYGGFGGMALGLAALPLLGLGSAGLLILGGSYLALKGGGRPIGDES